MKNYWLCLWIGIAVWSLSGTVSAVVLRPIDDSELIARSTHVSLSRVAKIESFWKEAHSIMGQIGAIEGLSRRIGVRSILVLGGTVDNLTQVVPGALHSRLARRHSIFWSRCRRVMVIAS